MLLNKLANLTSLTTIIIESERKCNFKDSIKPKMSIIKTKNQLGWAGMGWPFRAALAWLGRSGPGWGGLAGLARLAGAGHEVGWLAVEGQAGLVGRMEILWDGKFYLGAIQEPSGISIWAGLAAAWAATPVSIKYKSWF